MLFLGDTFPNFKVNTTQGEIDFHNWLGNSWGILFSHPSDFTPVCTTELARVLNLIPEFIKRNVKVIGMSCDSIVSHDAWCKDIKCYADMRGVSSAIVVPIVVSAHGLIPKSLKQHLKRLALDSWVEGQIQKAVLIGTAREEVPLPGVLTTVSLVPVPDAGSNEDEIFPYPIIEDKDRSLATKLGMVDKDEKDSAGIPLTARAVFIIDNKKKFRLSFLYPATTGRNFDEILRVLDSLQLTDKAKVATPVDWKMGDDCMVLPTVPEDQLTKVFPQGVTVVPVPSGKTYIKKVACPEL